MELIKRNYENAVAAGDKNVYFISGRELMRLCGVDGTVDITHPTNLGFFSMAKAIIKKMKQIIK